MKPGQYFLVIQLIVLSACGPGTTPVPETSEAPVSPELVPIDLAGPEMQVGSTYLYADGSVLVAVPAGTFTMGADGPNNPQHQVDLSDFWIYRNKVTNAQYAYCVALGQCTPPLQAHNTVFEDPLRANDPMVGVNYDQSAAYCNFVHARLPTEAEWEKAARGPNANIYPWGDETPDCDLLNYDICVGDTTPVNRYPTGRSYYDAYDMEGNALEWVADWYQDDYYLVSPPDDPPGPDDGQVRSVRGSAFNSGGNQTEAFNRFFSPPEVQRNNLGFRCVVEAEDIAYFAPFCDYPATYGTDGIGGAVSGEQSIVDCPVISIEQNPYCQGTSPRTIVEFKLTFSGPLYSLTYNVPGSCNNLSNLKFDCAEVSPGAGSGGDPVVFCSYCNVTLKSPPQCPDGYDFDPDSKTCLAQALPTTGACLPGFTLGIRTIRGGSLTTPLAPAPGSTETADQCCTFTPPEESAGGSNPMCIVQIRTGSTLCLPTFPSCPAGTSFDGQECISVEHPKFCIDEAVQFNSCTPGGGGPQGCPDPGCGINYIWNPTTCTCDCNGC